MALRHTDAHPPTACPRQLMRSISCSGDLLRLDSSRIVSGSSRRHWGPFWRVCARGPMTLHLRESTIHEQFDSRDVAAIVGCEKHDGFSSLIGRSEPSERNALGDHLFAFLAYL